MREKLEQLGLLKNEAEVYLALLEIGQTTTGAIIKKLGIHRNIVYESLDKLEKRGLVTQTTISGKMHFQVINPDKLIDIEKEKLNIAQNVVGELKKIQRKEKQEITVHQGTKEMEEVRRNIIKELDRGGEYSIINAVGQPFYQATRKFHKKLDTERIAKDIKQKLLISSRDYSEVMKTLERMEVDDTKTDWKVVPSDFKSPAAILTYLDKVIFQIIPEDNPDDPTLITIKNKDLAKSYKAYFELLWNQEVKVYRGLKDVFGAFNKMIEELDPGEEYYVLGANWGQQKQEVFDFFVDLHKKRQAKKVKANLLFSSGTEDLVEKYKGNYKLANIKYLPQGIYSGIQINLYKNKVIFIVWREEEPIVFEIEDEKVYQVFKSYFDVLWEQKVKVYKGREAIEVGDKEMLSTGELCAIGMGRKMTNKIFPELSKLHKKNLDKNKVKARYLISDLEKKDEWFYKGPTSEYKVLPKEYFSPVTTITYGNKVSFWVWSGDEPTVTIIEDKNLAESQMVYFNLLWNQKTRQYWGKEGISRLIDECIEDKKDIYFLGSTGIAPKRYPDIYQKFEKNRIKNGIKRFDLSIEDVRGTEYAKAPNIEIRYLPNEFGSPTVTWIFGDKFVNIVWLEEEIVNIIEDQGLVDSFMKRFNYLWSIAKK